MTLFNHSLHGLKGLYSRDQHSYRKLVAEHGFDFYETRSLGISQPGDVVQLDPKLRAELPYIKEHYTRVGLRHASKVVWDVAPEVASDFPDEHLSVYMFAEVFNNVRPDPERLQATKMYLDKNSFMRRCEGVVQIPPTVFGNTARPAPDYAKLTFPLFVKGAISATGSSVYKCNNPQEVTKAIANINGDYQLQQAVDAAAFLSAQYNITPGGVAEHLADTEQIIEGVEYAGTRFPTTYKLPMQAIADRAAKDGLRGKMGVDVAVTKTGEFFALECNPRWNGALYPLVIAQKLHIKEWSTAHVPTRASSLKTINFGGLEYNGKTGIVLINWGAVKTNWLEVLFAGSPAEQTKLRRALAKVVY